MHRLPELAVLEDRFSRIVSEEMWGTHLPLSSSLVVVPTYNERENISRLLANIANLPEACDIFIVDDGSPDGTAEVVRGLAPSVSRRIYLLGRKNKGGLGTAYLDAYRWIKQHQLGYEVVLQMDADFSHDPRMIPLLVERARAYGVAVGSRYVEGGATPDWSHSRLWLSRLGNIYVRWILRCFFPSYQLKDSTSGFVAWRMDVLNTMLAYEIPGDGYAYQTSSKLVAFRVGYPAIEVPIIFRDRRLGVSKLNRRIVMEAFGMPWRLAWMYFFCMKNSQTPDALQDPSPKYHDNTTEMWDRYYASSGPKGGFSSAVHVAREYYFGDLFARRVIQLGGQARSYLELGVGTAQTLARLQRRTQARCVGVEKTPRAYELGKQYATSCEIVLGDAMSLPFSDQVFDVVYSLGLFEHFEPDEQLHLLREQARVCRSTVLIEVPARTPHMRAIMWFNRRVRGKRGVWADDELFSPAVFAKKFPGLPFFYYFDWSSGAMTCWFALKRDDIIAYVSSLPSPSSSV